MPESEPAESAEFRTTVFRNHSRLFQDNRFVYPVVSRRSGGVSVGVNLNPDKVCNFDCIYCQVNRRTAAETRFVEMDRLLSELAEVLTQVRSGAIFDHASFADTPAEYRRLNDIAFSGDGEPTTYRNFDDIVQQAAGVRHRVCDSDSKMVLITNASMFHRSHVQRGLEVFDRNNGQIWAKLDAGTEDYYRLIERTPIPFQQILDNITLAARIRPLVIQSLFMNVHGTPPTDAEIEAFCARLQHMVRAGGQLQLVQIYTVARPPAESFVTPLSEEFLQRISSVVADRTGLQTAVYL